MLRSLKDRPKLYTFGSRGPGVYLTDELLDSIAYRTLPANHKLVLIRAIRAYEKASGGDREDLSKVGFVFTYRMCGGDCDPKSFYGETGARANLVLHGFFTLEPKLKSAKPGAPDKFLPSGAWRKHQGPQEDLARLKRHESEREAYLQRGKKRKVKFLQAGKSKTKTIGKKRTDTIGKKCTDSKDKKAVIIGKSHTDTKQETGTSQREKAHGLIPAIPECVCVMAPALRKPHRRYLDLDAARDCGGATAAFNEWRGYSPNQVRDQVQSENVAAASIPFGPPELADRLRIVGVM